MTATKIITSRFELPQSYTIEQYERAPGATKGSAVRSP